MTDVIDITTAYSQALVDLGRANEDVVVLDADISDSCKTEPFYAAYPGRAFDLGVAEQSLPTYAAGLALMGKIPFYNTFAVFAVHRGFDMIRQSVAYNRANVKIVGHAAGQSLGYAGPSHHTLEDISCMRALPNMVILCPSDATEVRQMIFWMAEYNGPVYLRLSRSRVPSIHAQDYHFALGRTELLCEGEDISLYFTGDLAPLALGLQKSLQGRGIDAQVVNVPTLKPLKPDQILQHGRKTRGAITLEDHNIYGGLGSAVAEIYAEKLQKPVQRIGIPDTFTESDDQEVLWKAYGVSVEAATEVVEELLSTTE
jgi:transketolase